MTKTSRASIGVLAAVIVGCAGSALAVDNLASGAIFGGGAQKRAVCYFTNHGSTSVTISAFGIFSPGGTKQTAVIDTCTKTGPTTTLLSKRSCVLAANVPNNLAYGCRTRVSDKTNVRGTTEIRDASENVLNAQAMR